MPADAPHVRLASERIEARVALTRTVATDGARRGAVCAAIGRSGARRAEPGPCGPLVLEARADAETVELDVWGHPATPGADVEAALRHARGWVGLDDDASGFAEVVGGHPVLGRLLVLGGGVRLSRLPRIGEAFGRAVLGQLVQGLEQRRSIAQVAAMLGTEAPGGVWTWPTARQMGGADAWTLRGAGVSLRSARALHAAAVDDAGLTRLTGVDDWDALDRRLRAIPGCGAWTSAETRLALGDADAVSVGDYHLPAVIGHVLGGGGRGWDDAAMLELLAPFAPNRGRVIRMIEGAVARGLVSGPARRGPRRPLSAHRYW